jgi:peroxiredoxin 2/4
VPKTQFRHMRAVEVTFPVVSDLTVEVSQLYGMLQPSASTTQAVRAVFFIDPEGKARAILYYPLRSRRNFQEIKRPLLAMQTTDTHKVAKPADWQPGEEVIIPQPGPAGSMHRLVPLL